MNPNAREVELAILNCLLDFQEARPVLMPKLRKDMFTSPEAIYIYELCAALYDDKPFYTRFDADVRARREDKEEAFVCLAEADPFIDPAGADYYVQILQQYALRRHYIRAGTELVKESSDKNSDIGKLAEMVEKLQNQQAEQLEMPGLTPHEIIERDRDAPKFKRIDMGIKHFDTAIYKDGGSHTGTTEVIFGHTKHGKTQYAIWKVAQYMKQGYKCLYITLEDTDSNITNVLLNYFSADEAVLDNCRIIDVDSGRNDVTDIVNIVRYWNAREGIDVVCIDYLQYVQVQGVGPTEEVARIKTVSNRLTRLAKEQKTFNMLLAQPHRVDKYRKGWALEPEVRDLYGSSDIEKDAFCATAVFRPSEVKELQVTNYEGEMTGVKDMDGTEVNAGSVYIRQKLMRRAKKYSAYFRFVHTDGNGLMMASEFKRQNQAPPIEEYMKNYENI